MATDIDFTTPTIKPPSSEDPAFASPDYPNIDQWATQQDAPAAWDPDDDLATTLSKTAKTGLQTPSRYSSPIIQQGLDLIRQQGKTAESESMATLGERISQRGLVGSGIEATETSRLLEQLNQQRMGQEYGLLKDFAATESQDRATWANIALQTRAQQLTELGMSQDDAFRQAQLEQQKYQFGAGIEQQESEFARGLTEQQALRMEQFGFSREELNQRALEAQKQAELQGRSLDIQDALNQAEIDIRLKGLQQDAELRGEEFDIERSRMSLQGEQFDREIDLRTEDLRDRAEKEGRTLSLAEARLEAEKNWAQDELGERRADRAQEADISGRDLHLRSEQIKREYEIRDDELARDYAELDLRREQMWKAAGLDEDRLKLDAQRLQQEAKIAGEELSSREAMNRAELTQRSESLSEQIRADFTAQGREISAEAAMQKAEADAQRDMQSDRISAERDMFEAEMDQRRTEFADAHDLSRDQYDLARENAMAEIKDWSDTRIHELSVQSNEHFQRQVDRDLESGFLTEEMAERERERGHEITVQSNEHYQLQMSRLLEERMQELVNSGAYYEEEDGVRVRKSYKDAAEQLQRDLHEREAELQTWEIDNEKARWMAANTLEHDMRALDRATQLMATKMGIEADTFRSMTELLQMSPEAMQQFMGWTDATYDPDTGEVLVPAHYDDARVDAIMGGDEFTKPGSTDMSRLLEILNQMRSFKFTEED